MYRYSNRERHRRLCRSLDSLNHVVGTNINTLFRFIKNGHSFQQNRGASVPSTRSSGSLSKNRKPGSDSEIENYAIQNLNVHKKGLLGKKVSIAQMLAWSKVRNLVNV
jgi:hypothetical protein